jgi:hypothetical protein
MHKTALAAASGLCDYIVLRNEDVGLWKIFWARLHVIVTEKKLVSPNLEPIIFIRYDESTTKQLQVLKQAKAARRKSSVFSLSQALLTLSHSPKSQLTIPIFILKQKPDCCKSRGC